MKRELAETARPATSELPKLKALLTALIDHQTRLQSALDAQREAMRTADIAGMDQAAARVAELSREFERLEAQRLAVVGHMMRQTSAADANEPGTDSAARSDVPLSRLLENAPLAVRSELHGLAAALRSRMMAVADANRVATMVCREMSAHFRSMFDAMTEAASSAGGYGRSESRVPAMLDALA